ncbi:MFS transporter [Bacillus subtilis]
MEYYDIGVYALVAPTIALKFFPHENPAAATLSTFAIFALGFFARPLGGLVFGYIGDRFGRTHALTAALLMMAVATVAIGCLPVWVAVGVFAPHLLLVFSVLDSI